MRVKRESYLSFFFLLFLLVKVKCGVVSDLMRESNEMQSSFCFCVFAVIKKYFKVGLLAGLMVKKKFLSVFVTRVLFTETNLN
jgi:hypothetical protein